MDLNSEKVDLDVPTMDQHLRGTTLNVAANEGSLYSMLYFLSQHWLYTTERVEYVLKLIQLFYYPILAAVGVPVNIITIVTLTSRNCGLSKCVSRYLVAMSVGDLLVVILDLILRHIPILYQEQFYFLRLVPVCNIHAVLLYAATDCSVWFTVTFTFDRFVAICCPKLKSKYCSKKSATVVLGTVTVLSCLKNIFWYFMLSDIYQLVNNPWFCGFTWEAVESPVWGTIEFLHNILTPTVPFVLILLLNALTVRHILVGSRARRRLRAYSSGENPSDPEMESRRKSIILLFVISANFILLWSTLMVYSIWIRMYNLDYMSVWLDFFVMELGFILQLTSCCTNTVIYAVTQTHFRQQLKKLLKYPLTSIRQLNTP